MKVKISTSMKIRAQTKAHKFKNQRKFRFPTEEGFRKTTLIRKASTNRAKRPELQ